VGESPLIIEASQSHSLRHTSLGRAPLTSDQPDAETSTWQHTTFTRERHPCPRRDSNPQYQQANGRRPTPYLSQLFIRPIFHKLYRERSYANSTGIIHLIPTRFMYVPLSVYLCMVLQRYLINMNQNWNSWLLHSLYTLHTAWALGERTRVNSFIM
jgi:hypothetical protein